MVYLSTVVFPNRPLLHQFPARHKTKINYRLFCILSIHKNGQLNGVMFPHFPVKVVANLGGNVTLPCRLPSKDTMFFGATGVRVKWTKIAGDQAFNEDVLLSMGFHKKTFGSFEDRVFIVNNDNEDGSILITNIAMQDTGKYQCELINGMTDVIQEVYLEVISSLRDGKYTFATIFQSCSVFVSMNFCFIGSHQQANRSRLCSCS